MVEGAAEGSSALRMAEPRRGLTERRRRGRQLQQQQRQKQRRQRWRRRWREKGMTVLSGGGERSERDGRRGGSLIEKMVEHQSAWMLRRRGHCAGEGEGAG